MKRKETRVVLIDETKRLCDICNVEIVEEVQDEGRTLKLFLKKK